MKIGNYVKRVTGSFSNAILESNNENVLINDNPYGEIKEFRGADDTDQDVFLRVMSPVGPATAMCKKSELMLDTRPDTINI